MPSTTGIFAAQGSAGKALMGNERRVYLDFNATTPCDERVVQAMLPFFAVEWGNPASRHWSGRKAESAVATAREQVAALIAAAPSEIIWTSGATEANNLAIQGVAQAHRGSTGHIVTQATEHKAVLDPVLVLKDRGFEVTILNVDQTGRVSRDEMAAAIRPDTLLVSVMWANNETGVVQPIHELVAAAKGANPKVIFHSDATQAVGKISEANVGSDVDLMSFSAHKLYGPKGCGALYVRRRRPPLKLEPLLFGGGQERGFRSGTLNVPGVVGFGEACRIAMEESPLEQQRIRRMRDDLWSQLNSQLESVRLNGGHAHCLPNTLSVTFDGASAESILMACDDVAMSAGSACTSTSIEPSHVLIAMGLAESDCFSSIRISLGRMTTQTEVQYAAERLVRAVRSIRALAFT